MSAEPWAVDRMGRVRVPFALAHDDLGPVIRWAFPAGDQSGGADGAPGASRPRPDRGQGGAGAGGEEDVRGP